MTTQPEAKPWTLRMLPPQMDSFRLRKQNPLPVSLTECSADTFTQEVVEVQLRTIARGSGHTQELIRVGEAYHLRELLVSPAMQADAPTVRALYREYRRGYAITARAALLTARMERMRIREARSIQAAIPLARVLLDMLNRGQELPR